MVAANSLGDIWGTVPNTVKPNVSVTNLSSLTVRSSSSNKKAKATPTMIPNTRPMAKFSLLLGETGVVLATALEMIEILSTFITS